MKRYSKISGMTLIDCDWKGACGLIPCAERFCSCSVQKIVPDQARAAGWILNEVDTRPDSRARAKGSKPPTLDLCPKHAKEWCDYYRVLEGRYFRGERR